MEERDELEQGAAAADEAARRASHNAQRRRAAALHERAAVFYELLGKPDQAAEARAAARRARDQADADLPGARERDR